MTSSGAPVEPGCYIVRSLDVGDVEEWGPRLAGPQRRPGELVDLLFAWRDAGAKLPELRWIQGGQAVTGGGLVTRIEPTDKGRAVLALADALERGRR
jgi:hypothetical protein